MSLLSILGWYNFPHDIIIGGDKNDQVLVSALGAMNDTGTLRSSVIKNNWEWSAMATIILDLEWFYMIVRENIFMDSMKQILVLTDHGDWATMKVI